MNVRASLLLFLPATIFAALIAVVNPPGDQRNGALAFAVAFGVMLLVMSWVALCKLLQYRCVCVDGNNVELEERRLLVRRRMRCTLDDLEIGYCTLHVITPSLSAHSILLVTPLFEMVLSARHKDYRLGDRREEFLSERVRNLPIWAQRRLVSGLPMVKVSPSIS